MEKHAVHLNYKTRNEECIPSETEESLPDLLIQFEVYLHELQKR